MAAGYKGRWKATPSQIVLAWLLGRSLVMLPILATSKVKDLEENVEAAELKIDVDTMRELEGMARASYRAACYFRLF